MNKIIYSFAGIAALFSICSCQKDFLKKPIGNDTTVDSIFSTSQKAQAAIAQAYSQSLVSGLNVVGWDNDRNFGWKGGSLDEVSGEVNATKFSWQDSWILQRGGMTADDGTGLPLSDDGFNFNYTAIRQDYLVLENIDKVGDMSSSEKEQVKAEMKTLVAYRYEEMFKRYGGVPIVQNSLSVEDTLKIPRATLQQTLDFIVKLCDEAASGLPDNYPPAWKGRVTKGVALAIKAEALMYAARPLFNSAAPYMNLGDNNNLISFGNTDPSRWQKAVDASKAVLDWSQVNDYHIINTGHPLDDYGNAVATPGNAETLLAYKDQDESHNGDVDDNPYDPHTQAGGANGMSYYQIKQYYKADGTEQAWAGLDQLPYSEYADKMEQMEARYKASAMAAGIDAWNNPNSTYWSSEVLSGASTWDDIAGNEACGRRVKFYYHAGTRVWFEYPLYRLAEFYLDLAEAYNELGQTTLALQYLNVIHERAALPAITETDKTNLRKIIQREWATEFYMEGHRLFDAKHWKLDDIDNGIIGGVKKAFSFVYTNGSYGLVAADYKAYSVQVVYTGFWSSNQYLDPFPASEINKGYLIQNPGY